ncbi:hypothetical protein BO70DRAFT_393738 [Aspergillus heteromorphus CBS 117.55]|uniref:Uncharacterized protein n=1 Tax=Aspergillus heteromorphus CBS 117.55 TaxID=1448321 RepID=A0A317WVA4_9EURO|nr:uncharacterized protein BO70DRAFT_393738 [Aspergillus heteromorphus CBS 117.55]PWY89232.1 hypothetical protein BO70DRAFT_393738 [Aspergillus heteromorphus CBS 117.55]
MASTNTILDGVNWYIPLPEEEIHELVGNIASLVKPLLAVKGTLPSTIARHINRYYVMIRYSRNSPPQLQGEQGVEAFLYNFYGCIFYNAQQTSFHDEGQYLLAQLILELRKLDIMSMRIWEDDVLDHSQKPILASTTYAAWAKARVFEDGRVQPNHDESDLDSDVDIDPDKSTQKPEDRCDMFVNLSAFIARCIRYGVLRLDRWREEDRFHYVLNYPTHALRDFFLMADPLATMQDCKAMVCAIYIIIAGETIRAHVIRESWIRGMGATRAATGASFFFVR